MIFFVKKTKIYFFCYFEIFLASVVKKGFFDSQLGLIHALQSPEKRLKNSEEAKY